MNLLTNHDSTDGEDEFLGNTSLFDVDVAYHPGQNKYRYRSEIKSKTIGLYQITDVTDLYKIENNKSASKLQTLQALQTLQFLIKKCAVWSWVYIFKHSLFRLKITVGCLTNTYPSIHVEDTLKITVG